MGVQKAIERGSKLHRGRIHGHVRYNERGDILKTIANGYSSGEAVVLNIDNEGAEKLATNPVYHKRTKHIDIRLLSKPGNGRGHTYKKFVQDKTFVFCKINEIYIIVIINCKTPFTLRRSVEVLRIWQLRLTM